LLIPTASVFLNDMNHNSSMQAIRIAIETFQNVWVPANGGTETEFVTRSDIILTDDEACIALGLY
jgi:hypothetical protein